MGIAYIKLAQILAMQNYGNLFTETDRKSLSSICDFVKPIPFSNIKNLLENEYGQLDKIFKEIDEKPIGAASISQVHKGILLNGDIVAIKIKRKAPHTNFFGENKKQGPDPPDQAPAGVISLPG